MSKTDRPGDPGLRFRLLSDSGALQACLAWLVEGAHAWYQAEQVMPEDPKRIQADTLSWRGQNDLIAAYFSDRLFGDPERHVMSSELFEDFNDWLKRHGHMGWSDRTFVSRFGDHDAVTEHGIVRRKKRRDDATLSQRPPVSVIPGIAPSFPTPPASYAAWLGVRFKTSFDETFDEDPNEGREDAGDSGTELDATKVVQDHVPGVPASRKSAHSFSRSNDFREAGTPGTAQVRGDFAGQSVLPNSPDAETNDLYGASSANGTEPVPSRLLGSCQGGCGMQIQRYGDGGRTHCDTCRGVS